MKDESSTSNSNNNGTFVRNLTYQLVGLAASGTLVAGVRSSEQIQGNSTAVSVINNGTAGFVAAQEDPNSVYSGTIFNVGYGMVQVAIGISVGLYLSALVVYPFGKRRSGLFSF